MNPSSGAMTHERLIKKATNFLKYQKNCGVVLVEHVCATTGGEIPDVIGWKNRESYLIECKASRADFFKDRQKSFRDFGGHAEVQTCYAMGRYRYYFVPDGMIAPDEVPFNWGLVYLKGRIYQEIITCDHQLYQNESVINRDHPVRRHKPTLESLENEIRMLTSALRKQAS